MPHIEKLYPVMLNLSGKRAVVVGCGPVGRRRAEMLLACGAKVRLVAPNIDAPPDGVEPVLEEYRPDHLEGAVLVLACTDDRGINAQVARDARARGAWVNVADDPAASDFSVPAVYHGGGVVLAVGTLGGAPALAAAICEDLVKALPAETDDFAIALSAVREKLKVIENDRHKRQQILRRLSGPEGQAAFRRGGLAAMLEMAGCA